MRLLNSKTMRMRVWYGSDIPPYIILSHRWEREEDEVTLQDFESGTAETKYGYRKIKKLCEIARNHHYDWVWLDTCCIDKRNAVELSEAINSMYKWYQNSRFCVAYLFDYRLGGHRNLRESTWFRRCWTLQELIAPSVIMFYDNDWTFFGTKQELCNKIARITGVDEATLSGADPRRCPVAQRFSWAAGREATRIEDEAYSLIGLFGLSLPMLYGDGEKAFMALQKEILQNSSDANDQSIFAWSHGLQKGEFYGLLAKNVSAFAHCGTTRRIPSITGTYAFSFTGAGFQLNIPLIPYGTNTYLCPLDCATENQVDQVRDCIFLEKSAEDDQYSRICRDGVAKIRVKVSTLETYPVNAQKKVYVQQIPRHVSINVVHGFLLRTLELPDYTVKEHRKVQLRSRYRGGIETASTFSMLIVPEKQWGSAGIIHFPQPKAVYDSRQIRCMKLGFDENFEPMCLLSTNSTTADSEMYAPTFFDRSREAEMARWANSWLPTTEDLPKDLRCFSLVRENELRGRGTGSWLQQ